MGANSKAARLMLSSVALVGQIKHVASNHTMDTIGDVRLANLELLISSAGTLEAVATKVESTSIYLSQIRNKALDSKTRKPREMGTKMARRLEDAFELDTGWMDRMHQVGYDYTLVDGRVVLPTQLRSDSRTEPSANAQETQEPLPTPEKPRTARQVAAPHAQDGLDRSIATTLRALGELTQFLDDATAGRVAILAQQHLQHGTLANELNALVHGMSLSAPWRRPIVAANYDSLFVETAKSMADSLPDGDSKRVVLAFLKGVSRAVIDKDQLQRMPLAKSGDTLVRSPHR